ncbi:MAG TPA: SUMF1/EgtB/PvdO family nonheme iron enzyme [bacterium]|nr:SUMF1/EgtB/PvdO family nonheme iron enzyme [bacterium]
MKDILLFVFTAIFFSACIHDSSIIPGTETVLGDFDHVEFEITDEMPVLFPDETADEIAEETQDISVDEEIDESVEYSDHTVYETPDEILDEVPDDDYIFEAPESMVLIPAGGFWMGSPEDESMRYIDETLHYVVLTKGFYMDKHEVRQEDFEALMGYNPSFHRNCGGDCPVEWVTWNEAALYANARSEADGLELCFECSGSGSKAVCNIKENLLVKPQKCRGYRFPTESEWEYSARAGTDTVFYYGDMLYTDRSPLDTNLDAIAWYGGNSGIEYEGGYPCSDWYDGAVFCGSHPVGQKLPNGFGLYDITGNVREWTIDWSDKYYPEGSIEYPAIDPVGARIGTRRIIRGCSYYTESYVCRCAYRTSYDPNKQSEGIGFRLVKTE